MKYKKLEILTYERADIDRELCLRKNPYLTTFLNFTINPIVRGEKITNQVYELFFNQIPPITSLSEKIMKQSSQIKDLNNSIPDIAGWAVIKKILINEVQSSNLIEGLASSKEELRTALEPDSTPKNNRYYSIINAYHEIITSEDIYIDTPVDIRKLYDRIFDSSPDIDTWPDGDVFRREPAYIYNGLNKVHTGIKGEENIVLEIEKLIEIMNRQDINFISKACICHYIFEYIHPFYDGNGRLGRFLMSSYLKRKLDIFTAISISYSLKDLKNKYRDMFLDVAKKKNYGELTHFVWEMMEIIFDGQTKVKKLLSDSLNKLEYIEEKIESLNMDELSKSILYLYSQAYAFDEDGRLTDNMLIDYLRADGYSKPYSKRQIRDAISSLEEMSYLSLVKRRPLIHELSDYIKSDIYELD